MYISDSLDSKHYQSSLKIVMLIAHFAKWPL